MPKTEKISVEVSAELAGTVREAVDRGEYASASAVVEDALHEWEVNRRIEAIGVDELRRLVAEGDASGPGIDADVVFARLRARYRAMAGE